MEERAADHTVEDALVALKVVQSRIRGAYSICAALILDGKPTMVVLRDSHGIRPVVVGHRRSGGWVASSESVALDVMDVDGIFEPKPGEAVFLRHGEAPIRHELATLKHTPCVFEFIYFARPDAVMSGQSVYEVRLQLGRELAKRIQKKGIESDVVIPVPDTARPAATTIAEELGLKLREGFIKNRYSGRTFIMPDSSTRERALRLKLNTIPHEIRNRRVLLVDDSIVRGTTLGRVIELVRTAGAREVHLAIHSPPVRNPCFYGIDMSTKEELFATQFAQNQELMEVEAARALGADSLTYLTVAALDRAFGASRCAACFDGQYPLKVTAADIAQITADRRQNKPSKSAR
jgi:amidophosphoribosyltransferase